MKIAIIDMDSMLYSAFMPNKVADEITGEPKKENGKFVYTPKTDEEIRIALDGIMIHLFQEGNFTHYIAYVKGKNTTDDRLVANPDYKAQRSKEIPEKWELTKQHAIEKWKAIEINNIEVDDAVKITSKNLPNSNIVAIDKDLLKLKGLNFNWRKNEWFEISEEEEEEYLSRSLIIGDTVDNLKGLPGKGEKFCDKWKIKKLNQAIYWYIKEYGFEKGLNEFMKNYKCLYILTNSSKFIKIPEPIKVPKFENNESKINQSRSSTGRL